MPEKSVLSHNDNIPNQEAGPKRSVIAADGNFAAVSVAYNFTEAASIYPITPSTPIAEQFEAWASAGRVNAMGIVPEVREMQSEAGAAGAFHGTLSRGALSSTFTASQGLLLMIPNLYKLYGERLPGVLHVPCRTIATHALSILGDQSDLAAVARTGVAVLYGTSPQNVHDNALVSHIAAIRAHFPFINAYDGFRTSHQLSSVEILTDDEMRGLIPWDDIMRFRETSMRTDVPSTRGTAEDQTFFQHAEAANLDNWKVIDHVLEAMEKVGKVTGRPMKPFEFYGDEDAEHIIITMGSSADVLVESVDLWKKLHPESKIGVINVRLYRPFSAKHLMETLPATTKSIAVLDRCKDPLANGEILYADVVCVLAQQLRTDFTLDGPIIRGRYGLSSKDFNPVHGCSVFAELAKPATSRRLEFTVGINDDVTHLSLQNPSEAAEVDVLPEGTKQCLVYGIGGDGAISSNKSAIKIISKHGHYIQAYFSYSAEKAGTLTVSHLRFGPKNFDAPYFIRTADYVACQVTNYPIRFPTSMIAPCRRGATFVINAPWKSAEEFAENVPPETRRILAEKNIRVYVVDATGIAADNGLIGKVNIAMQVAFFKLSEVMPFEQAIEEYRSQIRTIFARKGDEVINKNMSVIDATLKEGAILEIKYDSAKWSALDIEDKNDPYYVKRDARVLPDAPVSRRNIKCNVESCKCTAPTDCGCSSNNGCSSGECGCKCGSGCKCAEPCACKNPVAARRRVYITDILDPVIKGNSDKVTVAKIRDVGLTAGEMPNGTAAAIKRGIAPRVPQWQGSTCIQCNMCASACPHAVIRPFVMTNEEAEAAPYNDAEKFKDARLKEKLPFSADAFKIQISPYDCTGCGLCVQSCPTKAKGTLKMVPWEDEMIDEVEAGWQYSTSLKTFEDRVGYDKLDELVPATLPKSLGYRTPLYEFHGACAGCGEMPTIKILSQLVGNRLIVANSTGCSTIVSSTFPSAPYTSHKWESSIEEAVFEEGTAWSNSLFEDGCEYGFGMLLATEARRKRLRADALQISARLGNSEVEELKQLAEMLGEWAADDIYFYGQKSRVQHHRIMEFVHKHRVALAAADKDVASLISSDSNLELLVRPLHCIIMGDGAASDIGFGGLMHVLQQANGDNMLSNESIVDHATLPIMILMLDTEVYSNTGGQCSSSSPIRSRSKLETRKVGKIRPKKNISLMVAEASHLKNVYVSAISQHASPAHYLKSMNEAIAHLDGPNAGPALLHAIAPCISWGIREGMHMQGEMQKLAVKAGIFPLFTRNPRTEGKLVYQRSGGPEVLGDINEEFFAEYMSKQTRFQ